MSVSIAQEIKLLENVDLTRVVVNSKFLGKNKSKLGQYMTPASIAGFMASLFEDIDRKEICLLDPGAGIGGLTAAFVERLLGRKKCDKISVELFEIDQILLGFLQETTLLCDSNCAENGLCFEAVHHIEDFIEIGTEQIRDRLGLLENSLGSYTHCILNPPYKKISNSSRHRRLLRSIGIETSNLYSAFVAIAIELLQPGGEIVAIIPRSFCNGAYFQSFRNRLLNSVSIRRIHVFESRKQAFKDDDVLQENIILYAVKRHQEGVVKITSSTDSSLGDMTERIVAFEEVVRPSDPDRFIHIAVSDLDQEVVNRLSVFNNDLISLDIDVSTGPVVDFRLREHLLETSQSNSCPLIYPCHFHKGYIQCPQNNITKPNAIVVNEATNRWLFPDGCYTLTRRFSAKEEQRRIVPSVCLPCNSQSGLIGFENHINVFHQKGQGLDPLVAKGLAVYLSSTLFDMYFRQFSGHTQVNAADLRQMPWPSRKILKFWGGLYDKVLGNQQAIDGLVENTIIDISAQEYVMDPTKSKNKIEEALYILKEFGLPKAQQNERSALTLLALLDILPDSQWASATSPLMGITPIMDFSRDQYGKNYAPNTRETFRRQTMHQFVDAGVAIPNPDEPDRPINSPNWVYQISSGVLELIQTFGGDHWDKHLSAYLKGQKTLAEKYAKQRKMRMIPLKIDDGTKISLSPGEHSELIKDIIEGFGPRYAPGAEVLYVGDTGEKKKYFDEKVFAELNLCFDHHGKFPDVVLYYRDKNWLLLVESVTSHGPVDAKRHRELLKLFSDSKAGLVFVTAFPDRKLMAKYLSEISWETEVWVVDNPTHIIHFNGERFLGPYTGNGS